MSDAFPPGLRYLTPAIAGSLFEFPADMATVPVEVIRLTTRSSWQYHAEGWEEYARRDRGDALALRESAPSLLSHTLQTKTAWTVHIW